MSRLDGAGPRGQGPMTGRGLGKCSTCGNIYQNTGRGRGPGIRRFWESSGNNLQDLKLIESQLNEELKDLQDEIASVEKQTK